MKSNEDAINMVSFTLALILNGPGLGYHITAVLRAVGGGIMHS